MIFHYKTLLLACSLVFSYFFLFHVQPNAHLEMLTNFSGKLSSQNLLNEKSSQLKEENESTKQNPTNQSREIPNSLTQAFAGLQTINFIGEWKADSSRKENTSLFMGSSGYAAMKISSDIVVPENWPEFEVSNLTRLQLVIIDGEYYDDRLYLLEFNELFGDAFDPATLVYSVKGEDTGLAEHKTLDLQKVFECNVNVQAHLDKLFKKDSKDPNNYVLDPSAPLDFEISSSNCGINFKITFHKDQTDYEKKTVNYSILLTVVAIVNLYAIAKMIKISIESHTEANKISMLTIGFITVWDTYIFLAHLFVAISRESLFHFFIMPTFWYFILFSIFEVKLLIIVWRARYFVHYDNFDVIRRAALGFYCKLYSAMFVLLILFYKYTYHNWFLLLMSLYLVPQIIHNVMRGGRIDFNYNYMFCVIGSRVFLPLYFKGCPQNLIQIRPSFFFCMALILLVGGQIAIVYYQSIHGSKFFVPTRFLPPQYDYLYSLPDDLEAGLASQDDCAVCMNSLGQDPNSQDTNNTHARLLLNKLKPRRGQIMKTPCNHKFHVSCLVEWMSIKMECPTCRSILPVLD